MSRIDLDGTASIYVEVLGPVSAWSGENRLMLGPVKQRGVLAVLVCGAGKVITVSEMIAALWGQDPPRTATKMIHAFVSRLRSILGSASDRLETVGRGYRIILGPDDVDLLRSRRLVKRAEQLRNDEPMGALSALDEAAALWQGIPLADLTELPVATTIRPALDEECLDIHDTRVDLLLELGRHQQAISELRRTTVEQPLRSRPHDRLMLALYRDGRQAEALEVFARHRAILAGEVGLEPSLAAVTLHRQILRQDPSITSLPATHPSPPISTSSVSIAMAPARPPTALRRHRWAGVAAALVLLAGGTAGAIALADHHTSANHTTGAVRHVVANTVVSLDADTGAVLAATAVGHDPGPIAISKDSVWTASGDDRTVTRLSLKTGQALANYGLSTGPIALTAGADTVWVSDGFDGTLSRILIDADQLTQPFYPDRKVSGLVAASLAGNDLWVAIANHTLVDLDAASLQIKSTSELPQQADHIAVGDGAVWAIAAHPGGVFRVQDKQATPIPVSGRPRTITIGLGSVWVGTSDPDRLWQLRPDGTVVGASSLSGPPSAATTSQTGVWVAEGTSGKLERVDPTGHRIQTVLTIGHPVGGLASDGTRIWLTID
jgi:DNA-binding SARP family transcriptional activator